MVRLLLLLGEGEWEGWRNTGMIVATFVSTITIMGRSLWGGAWWVGTGMVVASAPAPGTRALIP